METEFVIACSDALILYGVIPTADRNVYSTARSQTKTLYVILKCGKHLEKPKSQAV